VHTSECNHTYTQRRLATGQLSDQAGGELPYMPGPHTGIYGNEVDIRYLPVATRILDTKIQKAPVRAQPGIVRTQDAPDVFACLTM
jgi:hypothetical protein